MRTVVVSEGRAPENRRAVWVWGLVAKQPPGVERVWVTDPFGRAPVDVNPLTVQFGGQLFTVQVRDSIIEGMGL